MTPQSRFRVMKIVAFLTALLTSALVTMSGEQPGSTDKWIAPAAEAQKKNPVAASKSSLAAGQKIYVKRCVACHGKTGNGDGPDAADLGIHPAKLSDPVIREETDGELFWKISEGRSPMISWKGSLSETQRWELVNYIKTFAGK